jgi:D-alanyl-D-alanine carboxypeptidase
MLLAPLPLPRSTAVAPVRQVPAAVVAAAAPATISDLLTAPQRWPHSDRFRSRPVVAATARDLAAALERVRSQFHVYGAEMAVSWDGDRTWSDASGVMRDGKQPLTADQPLVIGSITKTFTASLILQLIHEGRLALDAPVVDYLPDEPGLEGVTVRELLSHTSGLADLYVPLSESLLTKPDEVWTPDQVLRRIGQKWFEPGTAWGYSNTNYVVLGLLAERVTGEPVAKLLDERFFRPLGLDQTRLISTDGGTLLDPAWATAFWTAGAVCSSASDLVRWGDALYGGHVLDSTSLRQMLTFNDDDYGLGARRLELGDHVGVGHTGLLATNTAILVHLPAERVTVALIVNRSQVDVAGMLVARVGDKPSLLDVVLAAR